MRSRVCASLHQPGSMSYSMTQPAVLCIQGVAILSEACGILDPETCKLMMVGLVAAGASINGMSPQVTFTMSKSCSISDPFTTCFLPIGLCLSLQCMCVSTDHCTTVQGCQHACSECVTVVNRNQLHPADASATTDASNTDGDWIIHFSSACPMLSFLDMQGLLDRSCVLHRV